MQTPTVTPISHGTAHPQAVPHADRHPALQRAAVSPRPYVPHAAVAEREAVRRAARGAWRYALPTLG